MRASFIMWNICFSPLCGSPTSSPTHSPRSPKLSRVEVVPRYPILWKRPASETSLRRPRLPSSFTRNFGTMKSEIPFTPGGPPGIFASTRWTMFSARSWSPAEMKIFVPKIE